MKNFLAYLLLIAGLTFLFAAISNLMAFQAEQREQIKIALANGKNETIRIAQLIELTVASLRAAAEKLASEIASGEIQPHQINQQLKQILSKHPHMDGIGVHFLVIEGSPRERLRLPFYHSRDPKEAASPIALVEIADIPITHTNSTGIQTVSGRVVVDISRWALKGLLHRGRFGKFGFPFLVNEEARFLTYPSEEYDAGRKTLFQAAAERSINGFKSLANIVVAGKSAKIEVTSPHKDLDGWIYSSPIPSVGWSVCTMILSREVSKSTISIQRHLMQMFAGLIGFLVVATIIWLVLLKTVSEFKAWTCVTIISLLLSFGTGAIWYQTRIFGEIDFKNSTPMIEAPMLEHFQEEYQYNSLAEGFDAPIFIPTGLFIQTINFDTSVDVTISGYLWQKYPLDFPASISHGVTFPEASSCEFESSYERIEGNTKIVGWSFNATLRLPFGYTKYPFERENLWIRMWHKDFDKNIVLVPDFQSYNSTSPASKPGIEKQITLPSWEIIKSFFSYRNLEYNSNFGLKNYQGQQKFPELFYNIIIRRSFLDPFISNLMPILLVTILMFILKLTATKDENTGALLGYNANVVLSGVAALFFIVIFAQIDLRQRMAVEAIMYLDYYYFAVYLIFLVVSVDAIVFSWTEKFQIIQFRDNLIPKLLYWPMTMLFIYGVTIWVFYP